MTPRNWFWLSVLLSLPLVAWMAVWANAGYKVYRANAGFAAEMFGGIVNYDQVLASKKWFSVRPMDLFTPFGSGRYECTFAVVQLGPDVSPIPPSDVDGPSFATRFSAGWEAPWRPGPSPWTEQEFDTTFSDCTRWGGLGAQRTRLLQAAADPDGWWRGERDGLFLYSANARIAAWIRLGD